MLFLVDHVTKVFFFVTECLCLMVPWKLFISSRLKIKPALCLSGVDRGASTLPFPPLPNGNAKEPRSFFFSFFPSYPFVWV